MITIMSRATGRHHINDTLIFLTWLFLYLVSIHSFLAKRKPKRKTKLH